MKGQIELLIFVVVIIIIFSFGMIFTLGLSGSMFITDDNIGETIQTPVSFNVFNNRYTLETENCFGSATNNKILSVADINSNDNTAFDLTSTDRTLNNESKSIRAGDCLLTWNGKDSTSSIL